MSACRYYNRSLAHSCLLHLHCGP